MLIFKLLQGFFFFRYRLPIKICILDDKSQQMVAAWQKLFFAGNFFNTGNEQNPDYCKLAEAVGIKAMKFETTEDLDSIDEFLFHEGPSLGHFQTIPDVCLPMVAPGKALDEMFLFQDREKIWSLEEKLSGEAPS